VTDDPVAEIARRAGYRVSRGEGEDVLARTARAARDVDADLVMRVTSDCPFIDPGICGRVRDLFLAARDAYGADYACNNMPAKFPHGLDCEVFAAERLYDAEWFSRSLHEREHVTPWLRTREDVVKACLAGPGTGLERLRWTLDYPEDLAFVRAIYREMGEDAAATASWVEIAALCLRRPDLVALNAERSDEARLKSATRADLLTTPTRFALAA
jgi:spore coat polysaccharide biosynthesis protein SpsF (cytidylyltransferase family)